MSEAPPLEELTRYGIEPADEGLHPYDPDVETADAYTEERCRDIVRAAVTVDEVNAAFRSAAAGALKGVLAASDEPLVSVDYTNDTRSGVVDALSTMVINGTQVKMLVWYDNEMGYVHRMMELVAKVSKAL